MSRKKSKPYEHVYRLTVKKSGNGGIIPFFKEYIGRQVYVIVYNEGNVSQLLEPTRRTMEDIREMDCDLSRQKN